MAQRFDTQVAIIGAGPAGMMLRALLSSAGIECIVVERRSQAHVEGRIRAGVLEQTSVDLVNQSGAGERMTRQGLVHAGISISDNGRPFRVDFAGLTGGKTVTIYGQTELQKDLDDLAIDSPLLYQVQDVSVHDIESDSPSLRCRTATGAEAVITARLIAGCDGFHGVSRQAIPRAARRTFERLYPFAWLGILADAPPVSDELVYAHSDRGFALFSMRSPTRSRCYLQCQPDEDLDQWPDERIWRELATRLGGELGEKLQTAPALEKSVTPMRSFVCEPMRHGRLFLAGDAAHIVPPTGAKGLNLAFADVRVLAAAMTAYFAAGDETGLDDYSRACLSRVWKAQRFSWWMTSLLHQKMDDPYGERLRSAEIDYLRTSPAARTVLAENYVGLPF